MEPAKINPINAIIGFGGTIARAIIAGAFATLFMGENTIKIYFVAIAVVVFIMLILNFMKVLTKK